MGFSDLKLVYVVSCVVLGLIIVAPTVAEFVVLPGGERFSELWLLGQGRMAEDYPFNVRAGESYGFYLGLGNHMGGLEDYLVFVKFRNQSESLPDSVNGTASVLEPVFEYRVFLGDGGVWEREVRLGFEGVVFDGNVCRVSRVVLDGVVLSVDKVAVWDSVNKGFYCQLFFELWFYNSTLSGFQYHDRFVGMWLNMTVPS
jgi:hypothetical protein